MAKGKVAKGPKGVPNRHLHARISYLYQAVNYLSTASELQRDAKAAVSDFTERPSAQQRDDNGGQENKQEGADGMDIDSRPQKSRTDPAKPSTFTQASDASSIKPALYLTPHVRSVSLKSQVRLSRDVKRSLCKRCDTLLIPGKTSESKLENLSYEGQKLWADVLLVHCKTCGATKRFPVGAKRQLRKSARPAPNISDKDMKKDEDEPPVPEKCQRTMPEIKSSLSMGNSLPSA